MPNYNAQENSKKNGEYFGGMGPREAGRKGGRSKGRKRDQNM